MAKLDPPTGETPLTGPVPVWGQGEWVGYGGDWKSQQANAWQEFYKLFGRNPTQSELTSLAPAFAGPNIHQTNPAAGAAAIAQYYQSLANTPANQEAQRQAQYQADAPKFYDQINGMFQQTLGRDATDAEKSHFGSLMASGNVDAYTVGQFLTALPEAVTKQDTAFRENLSKTLQGQDTQYYKENILPAIQSQQLRAGRSTESSGYANALALAAQQQNRQRESFLSGLTAQQYGNSQALAQNAYNQAYGNYQGLQNYSLQRSNQLQDATTNRVNELQNYAIQKSALDDYYRRYGKRSSGQGIGSLAGGIGGALVGGAATGWVNPMGYMAGYGIGSGLGGGIGSSF